MKINRTPFLLFLIANLSGCDGQVQQCDISENSHTSIYKDVVEGLYITIHINDGQALLIESRAASDVSPNPVSVKIDVQDGANWLVGIAIPIENERETWLNGGDACRRIARTDALSSFSCKGRTGLKTTYDWERTRGLNNIKVFDEDGALVSHMELVSEVGAFSEGC